MRGLRHGVEPSGEAKARALERAENSLEPSRARMRERQRLGVPFDSLESALAQGIMSEAERIRVE
jgi:hypothetical protein